MSDKMEQPVSLSIDSDFRESETAQRLLRQFSSTGDSTQLVLHLGEEGISLHAEGQTLQGDFTHMLDRLKPGRLTGELLVKAAKIKHADHPLTAIDATAGLGEDSLLLAAAGFHVTLYERNPVIFELLRDAVRRAAQIPELAEIVGRMQIFCGDSMEAMRQTNTPPDVILLDPMFPERQKSALVKKKLQMIQKLEHPCTDEETLILAAMEAKPTKLIVKRPPKGPYLAGFKPDYSITGKAVRFDCFVSPYEKIHKFKK